MRIPWLPRRIRIAGNSMLPVLRDGELRFLRTDPLARLRLRRGDVVVLRHPWDPGLKLVKRLAALPGDEVRCEYGALSTPGGGPRRLGENEFVVLSDNRAEGIDDGRLFGPVPRALIEGRVMGRHSPEA